MFAGKNCSVNRARSALPAGSNDLKLGYGRFMQTDPIGYDDGLNWYNYVGSDPINYVDPTGTDLQCNDGRYFSANELKKFGDTAPCEGSVVAGGGGSGGFGGLGGFGGFAGGGVGGVGSGSGGGGGPVTQPTPQNNRTNVCESKLQRAAEGLQAGGDALAYPGVALAAVGAAAVGPVGAAPGLAIAEIGGTAGAIGQAVEDYNHSRPVLEIAARFFVGIVGGRVAVAGLRALTRVGSRISGEFFDKALGEFGKRAVAWIDPDRCAK